MRAIYESEALSGREVVDPGPYKDTDSRELVGIYEHIDPAKAPERFKQLLAAIKLKVEASGQK